MIKHISLVAAAMASAALVSCQKQATVKSECQQTDSITTVSSIECSGADLSGEVVYIEADTILANYELSKQLKDDLMKKQNKAATQLQSRQAALQKKANDFKEKYERGAFISQDQFQAAQTELMKEEQSLQEMDAKLTREMMEEQQKMSLRLRDSIYAVLETYKAEGKYKMVLLNSEYQCVYWADPKYDITRRVLNDLNARLKK